MFGGGRRRGNDAAGRTAIRRLMLAKSHWAIFRPAQVFSNTRGFLSEQVGFKQPERVERTEQLRTTPTSPSDISARTNPRNSDAIVGIFFLPISCGTAFAAEIRRVGISFNSQLKRRLTYCFIQLALRRRRNKNCTFYPRRSCKFP